MGQFLHHAGFGTLDAGTRVPAHDPHGQALEYGRVWFVFRGSSTISLPVSSANALAALKPLDSRDRMGFVITSRTYPQNIRSVCARRLEFANRTETCYQSCSKSCGISLIGRSFAQKRLPR